MALTWVQSGGGPLLVAPRAVLDRWEGVSDDDGPVETWGDYGRACSIEGYVGSIPIGDQHGLVLGVEPVSTTFLPDELLFLRWAAADSESEIVDAARRALHDGVTWDEDGDLIWDVPGTAVLFDSTLAGDELEPGDHLVVDLAPGRYRVRATYIMDDAVWMILVQLQPIEEQGAGASARVVLGVDDLRSLPGVTRIARTSAEGVLLLEEHRGCFIDELWLDHDLGGDDSIMPVVTVLEEAAFSGEPFRIGMVYVHSANPSGAETVVRVLSRWGYQVRRAVAC
ncbi:Imm21 family immunity protein [Spirillospora sp. NPDC052269]